MNLKATNAQKLIHLVPVDALFAQKPSFQTTGRAGRSIFSKQNAQVIHACRDREPIPILTYTLWICLNFIQKCIESIEADILRKAIKILL